MNTTLIYGPVDSSVLRDQCNHRSQDVVDPDVGNKTLLLRARRGDNLFWRQVVNDPPHTRVLSVLHQMGFYGVYSCGWFSYDLALITALVERWRSETHTFHLRVGEATVTLQDVAVIWGLPIDGKAITGIDKTRELTEWQELCYNLLGLCLEEEHLNGYRIYASVLVEHLETSKITDDSTLLQVEQVARTCALLLLGGVMCPDTTGDCVPLLWLSKLKRVSQVRSYSWGSAVLAYLYRELCKACQRGHENIGGPLQLLQIWAWSRISVLRPSITYHRIAMVPVTNVHNQVILPIPPYGARWNCEFTYIDTFHNALGPIREALDLMLLSQFDWQPYNMSDPEIQFLPRECLESRVWKSTCPLIFYAIVEGHYPDRVLRQFGLRQGIPHEPEFNNFYLHGIDRRGRVGRNWETFHRDYIALWNDRLVRSVWGENIIDECTTEDRYNEWYDKITRRYISPTMHVVESGFQPGEAPLWEIVAGQMSAIRIGCDHRPHNIDGLNSLVDQHRSIATNVHRIATRRQSTNVLTNDQTEAPEVGQRRTTRRRTRSMRSRGSEDGIGPSTSNHRPAFTGHASSSYPDHTFSVSAPESYHVPDQPFTGGASTSYSIPQYLSSGIAVADPFTSAPPVSECGNVQEDCYVPQPLQQNDQFPFTPLAPHREFLSGQVDMSFLDLGLAPTLEPSRSEFNASPIPWPVLSTAYRDRGESSGTTASTRHEINLNDSSTCDDEETQPSEMQRHYYDSRAHEDEQIVRDRRNRRPRPCGTGGHF